MSKHTPITEDWLREIGFKWHEIERSPKHWLLWIGDVCGDGGFDALGVEVTQGWWLEDQEKFWYCWLRSDFAHRYSRFLHVRHLNFQHELVQLIEGLTGQPFEPKHAWYGGLRTAKSAAYLAREAERLDRRLVSGGHTWNDLEKDDSRGYPLNEHQALLSAKSEKP